MTVNVVALFLVGLILLGVLGNNSTITIAATVLLLVQQTALSRYLPLLEKHALPVGIILLTIGVLSPLVSGKVKLPPVSVLANWQMWAAMLVGAAVAWVAGRGVPLMETQPALITGLLIGTILGVSFLGGLPVGPLIAAGLLSLLVGKM